MAARLAGTTEAEPKARPLEVRVAGGMSQVHVTCCSLELKLFCKRPKRRSMQDGSIGIRIALVFHITLSAALTSCSDAEDDTPSQNTAPDAAFAQSQYTAPLSAGEWEAMDLDARKRFMRELVLPSMRPLFQDFDAERFAAFSCKTCHGSGVQAGDFEMPSADLPVLSSMPSDAQKPTADFMKTIVKPKLAELLGMQAAPGLRCGTCHPSAAAP